VAGSGGTSAGHGGDPTGGSTTGGSGGGALGGTGGLGGSAESGTGGVSGSSGAAGTDGSAGADDTGGTGGAGATGGGTGAGGSAGQTGGAAGAGGSAGEVGGSAGSGGSAGQTGTPEICSFEIEDSLSPAIPTVGIVDWSADLEGISAARIEFTLDDPAGDEINRGSGGAIDIAGQTHRALLLGLKAERTYTYRIIAQSGDTVCVSADRSLSTGAEGRPNITHTVTRTAVDGAAPAPGFIVTTNYGFFAYVMDTDGDLVWWASSPSSSSRARMDWEGEQMWMLKVAGTQGSPGEVRRVSMDGTDVLENVAGLENAHHDLAVLPGGSVATLTWTEEASAASELVERSPDGTVRTVVRLADNVFGTRSSFHANSIAYHALDDTFTVGDLDVVGYAKLSRGGELLWQFRGGCPTTPGPKCASGDLLGNHGHHLLEDGTFLFFKARQSPSIVYEYLLTETASSLSSTEIWSYDPGVTLASYVLGDVQRLPNGNTLIVYSTDAEMRELSPAGDLVQTITSNNGFGYADFRETLYGPPPR